MFAAIDHITDQTHPAREPARQPDTEPIHHPPRLAPHEQARLRAAIARAPQVYPGAVGQLVARELGEWANFGFRLDQRGLAARLVDQVMKAPRP